MAGNVLISRVPRNFIKTITFDGGSGSGAVGTVAVATVTGRVLIEQMSVACTTLLAGATATVEMGTANNTTGLIAQTTATEIDANEFWKDTSPEVEVSDALVDKLCQANIIITVGTAAVSSGVLEVVFLWVPMSVDGNIA